MAKVNALYAKRREEGKSEVDSSLVLLKIVSNPVEAERIKSLLESNGVRCVLQNELSSSVYPSHGGKPNKIKIWAQESDFSRARKIIAGRTV